MTLSSNIVHVCSLQLLCLNIKAVDLTQHMYQESNYTYFSLKEQCHTSFNFRSPDHLQT
jgi:hypothetical protein